MELTVIWQFLSIFGDIEFWIGAIVAAALMYFFLPKKVKKYGEWYIFGALPAVVISSIIVEGLKLLFKISRPCITKAICEAGYSFPSAHAAIIFAVMTVATVHSKSRKLDVIFLTLALLVSLSRVFLGYHRIEDIVAGGAIGVLVGYIIYQNYENIFNKFNVFLKFFK